MGKPTGFLEFQREVALDRDPLERVKDWDEFHLHFDESKLKVQGNAAWTAAFRSARQGS